ncbi:T9SS type A sorting domain-containing protein [Flammeovirga aprica]|uniref:T9SS type A sorting domain-containing protein n=1 Tax=Flammeovirga aprica JL-4 TaxID=694437 RepID=A0A7X9RXA1_9BACT|nr:T9SS type A sorting domain-containing protein [Flammeovirga aprica]NME70441.1 T9SS type A sorting domain-containing protein [Flammeovirga aprica JL-4]
MKKLFLISLLLNTTFLFAQNKTTAFDTDILSSSDYVVGVPYLLENDGTINGIQLENNATEVQAQFGIYADDNDGPGALIYTSDIVQLSEKNLQLSIQDIELEKGKYWIMTNYKTEGKHLKADISNPLAKVYYMPSQFGQAFPSLGYDFEMYEGHQFPIKLLMQPKEVQPLFEVFPNPTVGQLYINGTQKEYNITVFDSNAKKVLSLRSHDYNTVLEMESLQKGTYYVSVEGEETFRVLKK